MRENLSLECMLFEYSCRWT